MARILVVEPVAQPGLDLLSGAHDTQLGLGLGRDELLGLLAEGGGWDALVVRSQTRVDAELLSAAAPRLSVVGVASVGIDRIDVEAATRAGVMIVNAPTGNTIAAAEHTVAMMLALLRQLPAANASMQAGEWERSRYTGRELRGKTLGIIGLGKIGKAVARRAIGFEMRILASDPYLTEEQASEVSARLVGMAELLHRSDVITVHTPLTAQTRGLLGQRPAGGDEAGRVPPQRRPWRDRGRAGIGRCAPLGAARRRRGGRVRRRADDPRQPAPWERRTSC